MAQDLGLHQPCDDWNMPETEKQTRKRIWWSLYIMDRFNSALFGKPLTIVDEVRQTCLIKVHISDAVTNFSCG